MTEKFYGSVLLRSKDILDALLEHDGGLTLKEISDSVGESKSTTLKVLTTMQHIDMVRRDFEDKRYYIGAKMISYGEKAKEDFDILSLARPYLVELNNITSETVNLGIESNNRVTFLEKLESKQPVKLDSRKGGSIDMYTSSMGKAILATKSDEEIDEYLDSIDLVAKTSHTITDKEALRKDILEARKNGYATDANENQEGVFCVGVAIVRKSKVLGAISISTPEYRLDQYKLEDIKRLALSTKSQIEKYL